MLIICRKHTYPRTNLHFFSFTSKGNVFLFAQNEAFFSVSCHSLPFGKSCGPCCAADKADRRCFPTQHSISSDGPQHILPRSTVPSPSKHIAFSRSTFSKTSKGVLCLFVNMVDTQNVINDETINQSVQFRTVNYGCPDRCRD